MIYSIKGFLEVQKDANSTVTFIKLSLNVLRTHYVIFSPRSKIISDVDIKICNVNISRVYVTKFVGVQIDAQLNKKK